MLEARVHIEFGVKFFFGIQIDGLVERLNKDLDNACRRHGADQLTDVNISESTLMIKKAQLARKAQQTFPVKVSTSPVNPRL